MDNVNREFEVVVWGATGFTGRLVCEHLARHYGTKLPLRWAVGGRDRSKLEQLVSELNLPTPHTSVMVGDSHDRDSLDKIARSTSVVCSTVGPYAKYGSQLVAACVDHGTHYCDLSGEVQWMRKMIDLHEPRAQQTGARIVHCCGFDSIPSDLGCYFLQEQVQADSGSVCKHVKLRIRRMRGSFSGGTFASLLNVLDESRRDPRVREILADPYGLCPRGMRGPDGPDHQVAAWDHDLQAWTAPFVMAPINTRVVRRTNAILAYRYGQDFRYEEGVLTGKGPAGWIKAQGIANGLRLFMAAADTALARKMLNAWVLPQPGQGPSAEQREKGHFKIQLVGKPVANTTEYRSAVVTGDRDPGYGTTSKMLAESAVCLAQDAHQLHGGGGFWTPASCFGAILISRLQARAGMRFDME
jgi:short subunit dehydrogenase-like uncharacterized protein